MFKDAIEVTAKKATVYIQPKEVLLAPFTAS